MLDNLAKRLAWEEAFIHYEELELPSEVLKMALACFFENVLPGVLASCSYLVNAQTLTKLYIVLDLVAADFCYPHMSLVLAKVSSCEKGVYPCGCSFCGSRFTLLGSFVPEKTFQPFQYYAYSVLLVQFSKEKRCALNKSFSLRRIKHIEIIFTVKDTISIKLNELTG